MPKVLIIGGGIGGLTTAIALRRRGIDVAVYEAAPELRPVGKGIWVPTNAMIVYERLGLSDAVREAGSVLERIQLRDAADSAAANNSAADSAAANNPAADSAAANNPAADSAAANNTVLQDVDLRKVIASYGHPTIAIHRAELARVLAEALPAGTLTLDKRCATFEQDDRTVTVHFADGTTVTGDVLVGADGLHSAIRQRLFGDVPLRYSGQTCYRGIANCELPSDLLKTCWEVWGGERRFGFSRVQAGQTYWFAPQTVPPNSAWPESPLAEHLANQYAAFPAPIPDLLRHTPSAEIIRTDLFDFGPLSTWSKGRATLLGDAAHAMTPNLGQGGAQAIEDAYVLAEELSGTSDAQQAIRTYEQRRLPRARWFVKNAWRFGKLAHLRNRPARLVRNWLLRHTPEWVKARQLEWLYKIG